MTKETEGSGAALDAGVSVARTPDQQAYLDAIADDKEEAVKNVRRMVSELEKSLKDREAEAKTARAQARKEGK